MSNITISLNEDLIRRGRQYAEKHRTSLNALIRRSLDQTVSAESEGWLAECFALMDEAGGDSQGRTWTRDELHDV